MASSLGPISADIFNNNKEKLNRYSDNGLSFNGMSLVKMSNDLSTSLKSSNDNNKVSLLDPVRERSISDENGLSNSNIHLHHEIDEELNHGLLEKIPV